MAAIRGEKTPESDLDLAIDITLTLYAGYVSADEKGREVEVPRLQASAVPTYSAQPQV
jgi:hypothetical protein